MRYFCVLFLLLPIFLTAQSKSDMTAQDLLQKSLDYHDPQGKWPMLSASIKLKETRPKGKDRISSLSFDNSKSYFSLTQNRDDNTHVRTVENGQCKASLNGSTDLTEEQITKHRLDCPRTELLRNYYLYLWGLPMKLKDPGTILDPTVKTDEFQGRKVLTLRVTYDEAVGKDIWYFHFDPQTYAMIAYRFYHDETKNDGEYITLEGEVEVNGLRIPQTRKWYTHSEDKFLGTDSLKK